MILETTIVNVGQEGTLKELLGIIASLLRSDAIKSCENRHHPYSWSMSRSLGSNSNKQCPYASLNSIDQSDKDLIDTQIPRCSPS